MIERTAEPDAIVDVPSAVPVVAQQPEAPAEAARAAASLVESELLVEDVSIDGMCGVY